MKKEFTFKNYIVYALRYWLVVAVFAVVGLGGGILYGILDDDTEYVTFRGGVGIGGIGVFADAEFTSMTDNPSELYNTVKSGAFDEMTASFVRNEVYTKLESAWRALTVNKKFTKAKASEEFFASLTVWVSGDYMYVQFGMAKNEYAAEQNKFSEEAVNAYIEAAYARAIAHEPMLVSGANAENKIKKISAEEMISLEETDSGLIWSAVVGAALGVIVGLAIMLVVYLCDRRINSYGDIAPFTGYKLYDLSRGAVTNKVCPRIDCDLMGSKVLLVAGSEKTSRSLASIYGEYAAAAGNKTLVIDFAASEGGKVKDTFGDYMRGKNLSECVEDVFGVDTLCGSQSWALAVGGIDRFTEATKNYSRVVICAPYRNDGSLGVIAKISDKAVFAIDQSSMRAADVLGAAMEAQAADKIMGAVIEKAGKSFVGDSIYVPHTDEEE